MEKLYENTDPDVFRPFVGNIELSEDMDRNIEYFVGAKGIPFKEGIASESAIGAIAHSIVLLRMEPNADIEGAKQKMRSGIDPRKWICAGVDDDQVIVDNIGDVIILILSPDSEAYYDAFKKLV